MVIDPAAHKTSVFSREGSLGVERLVVLLDRLVHLRGSGLGGFRGLNPALNLYGSEMSRPRDLVGL